MIVRAVRNTADRPEDRAGFIKMMAVKYMNALFIQNKEMRELCLGQDKTIHY